MKKIRKIKIEKIIFGGKGLSRINGKVVFVDGVLPNEEVEVSLTEGKHFFNGKVLSIITPSPFRVENNCPYPLCGGCDFRHCSYSFELILKKNMLIDTLKRIAKTEFNEKEIQVVSSKRNGYRIKTGFKTGNGKIGFFKKKSHFIIDVSHCLQCPEHINNKLNEIRESKINKDFFLETHPFKKAVYFYLKNQKGEEIKIDFGKYIMHHRTGNFIQANRFLLKDFVNIVENFAQKGGTLLELYCGSGLFTLPLSFNYKKIYAYEQSKDAIEMLRKSLETNGIKNIHPYNLPAEDFEIEEINTVVVDPPRDGLSKTVIHKLIKLKPERIVYISCNASTFSRDLKLLSECYKMERLALIDNFPATAHFETVTLLRRKSLLKDNC